MTAYDMSECPHGLTVATCSHCRPKPAIPAPTRRPTTAPKSAADPIEPLHGTKDLSMPMYAIEPYLEARTDWLVAQGYPHDLRPGGWVYLRCGDRYAARARVVAMDWLDDRPWRTGEVGAGNTFGPGLVFRSDPDSWEPFDQPFGDDADYLHQRYRYHRRLRNGELRRFSAGAPIPDGDWEI